jgi:ankyrin repeat protein
MGYKVVPPPPDAVFLIEASERGDLEEVMRLLAGGASVSWRNDRGETALHRARSIDVLHRLIQAGSDVNATDLYSETPLHRVPDPEHIRVLIAAGANVNAEDGLGRTPVHVAVKCTEHHRSENYDELAALLEAPGVDVNARDAYGCTPLWYALESDYVMTEPTLSNMLVDAGADLDDEGVMEWRRQDALSWPARKAQALKDAGDDEEELSKREYEWLLLEIQRSKGTRDQWGSAGTPGDYAATWLSDAAFKDLVARATRWKAKKR